MRGQGSGRPLSPTLVPLAAVTSYLACDYIEQGYWRPRWRRTQRSGAHLDGCGGSASPPPSSPAYALLLASPFTIASPRCTRNSWVLAACAAFTLAFWVAGQCEREAKHVFFDVGSNQGDVLHAFYAKQRRHGSNGSAATPLRPTGSRALSATDAKPHNKAMSPRVLGGKGPGRTAALSSERPAKPMEEQKGEPTCASRVNVVMRDFHFHREQAVGTPPPIRPAVVEFLRARFSASLGTSEAQCGSSTSTLHSARDSPPVALSGTAPPSPLLCAADSLPAPHFADAGTGDASRQRVPPVLWSTPGSGSTMTRQLVDVASGVLTGSKYFDADLVGALPGEQLDVTRSAADCSRVSLIKVHPGIPNDRFGVCGGKVAKAVLLVRHPLRAALAEFQRITAQAGCWSHHASASHRRQVVAVTRPTRGWQSQATARTVGQHHGQQLSARIVSSVGMGHTDSIPAREWPSLHALWNAFLVPFLTRWAALWRQGGAFDRFLQRPGRMSYRAHVLRFESLRQCDTTLRDAALQRLLAFANLTTPSAACSFAALQAGKHILRRHHKEGSVNASTAFASEVRTTRLCITLSPLSLPAP